MEEFKSNVSFAFCPLNGFARLLPWTVKRTDAEHICTVPAERMPIAGSKAQMVFHAFTQYKLIRVVVAESQRVFGFWAFETNTIQLVEISLHNELHNLTRGEEYFV